MINIISMRALRLQTAYFCLFAVSLLVTPASAVLSATLNDDLQALVNQGSNLNTQLSNISISVNSCTDLGNAVVSVEALSVAVEALAANLTSPLTVDTNTLNSLDELTVISAAASALLPGLSTDLTALSLTSDLADINASMDAMLKLSDEIGVMANRILEMADKILLMADNIGDMADRILLTQQIQSTNIALTQSTMLTTQQNIIALASTIDTSIYNNALSSLIATGNAISTDLIGVQLTESNMSSELANFQVRINDYQSAMLLLIAVINADSSIASNYINSDTLTMMGDLSVINAALASTLNTYANTVNTLAPTTNITVLNDALNSMLILAADLGAMGNRIVEMGDDINIMADNIGVMALRIVETQTLQQTNLELTQSNLSAAQITSIQIIAAFGL